MNKAKGQPQHKGKQKTPKRVRVFVYGTLRRGSFNHSFLKGSEFITEAVTAPKYEMLVASYPWLLTKEEGGAEIVGEVYEVSPKTKEELDRLERGYACIPIELQGIDYEVVAYIATPESSMGQMLERQGKDLPRATDYLKFVAERNKKQGR